MKFKATLAGLALVTCAYAENLNDQTFAKFRAYIVPKPTELQFLTIPWLPTFWQGVLEGQRRDRPILLWAMNGHPLTCT